MRRLTPTGRLIVALVLALLCFFCWRTLLASPQEDEAPAWRVLPIDEDGHHLPCPAGYDRPQLHSGAIVCTRRDLKETF